MKTITAYTSDYSDIVHKTKSTALFQDLEILAERIAMGIAGNKHESGGIKCALIKFAAKDITPNKLRRVYLKIWRKANEFEAAKNAEDAEHSEDIPF